MPSESQSQQRLFGMVDAYKKGKLKKPSPKIKEVAEHISAKGAHDFAATKHTGLPDHVKKSSIDPAELVHSLPPEMIEHLQKIFNAPKTGTRISPDWMQARHIDNNRTPSITQVIPPNYQYKPTIKAAYIQAFIKRAFEEGLDVEGTKNLMEKAGFVKEAFLPFLIDMAAMLGGGLGADYLGGKLALRAATLRRAQANASRKLTTPITRAFDEDSRLNGAGKAVASKGMLSGKPTVGYSGNDKGPLEQNFSAKVTPKINTWEDRGNQMIMSAGQFHQAHPWAAGTVGSMIPMAAVAPLTAHMRGEDQPQGEAPPIAQYTHEMTGIPIPQELYGQGQQING